ncbi:DNA phosphorothioation-associated putative methyltransferase [Haloferula rosea]|uniref:DNA phosphorothioation-associated putative methyltransferase n=1 Tax=Haloferula rosea TaxID=490093 RepID=A0A934R8J4_9BACT|nr:DNA phosphorothioation-associated putative methyltransferase [Haloferula rosea]MBK1825938.1 DNA phosphorothioation-associated putative methyltransferase [Haloferula rosea]
MNSSEYRTALAALSYGKRLPGALYILDPGETSERIPQDLLITFSELRRRLEIGPEFNLLKLHLAAPKVSFLSYPDFDRNPHPELKASVIVDLVTGKVRRDDYSKRANPPILHRKETFLPPDDLRRRKFAKLTKQEEEAGLLKETSRIGFRLNWDKLVAEAGYGFRGHRLEKLEADPEPKSPKLPHPRKVARHKTAIVRRDLSKPVKTLLELNQLRRNESFFDYGCGYGGDVEGISRLGYSASGWDPVHASDEAKSKADVVNLGFVLNVIEDPAERVEVLADAWQHAERLLVVSTLISGQEAYENIRNYGDGVITSRNTFQKFFEPAEIQSLIEDTLHVDAVPVALGIYFAFQNQADYHDFIASRSRRFIDWESLSRKLGLLQALRAKRDPYETHRELLDRFWESVLELGRLPRDNEFEDLAEVRKACSSLPKALQLFIDRFGEPTFEAARLRRKEDLLVFVAASQLREQIPFSHLSERLQRDLRSFFGNYTNAQDQARELMFAAGDPDELELAVRTLDFGWVDENEGHFTIHRSLLDELPAILRVYIECGARLYGDPRAADLTKIHLHSGKLTFTYYEDFENTGFPELTLRIKVDLRKLFVNVFEHPSGPDRQLLFFKKRFISSDHPGRRKIEILSDRLRAMGITESNVGHGISKGDFEAAIARAGLTRALTK